MIKHTLTYHDVNDEERTEVFRFNLNKLEVMYINVLGVKGLKSVIEKIGNLTTGEEAFEFLGELVLQAYGQPNNDGGFEKNDEIRARFQAKEAHADFVVRLVTHPLEAMAFIDQLIPQRMRQEIEKANADAEAALRDPKFQKLVDEAAEQGADVTELRPSGPIGIVNEPATNENMPSQDEPVKDVPKEEIVLKFEDFSPEEVEAMSLQDLETILGSNQGTWPREALLAAMKKKLQQ